VSTDGDSGCFLRFFARGFFSSVTRPTIGRGAAEIDLRVARRLAKTHFALLSAPCMLKMKVVFNKGDVRLRLQSRL
jgi:hypothetical protein